MYLLVVDVNKFNKKYKIKMKKKLKQILKFKILNIYL